jgi:hypothetical protein
MADEDLSPSALILRLGGRQLYRFSANNLPHLANSPSIVANAFRTGQRDWRLCVSVSVTSEFDSRPSKKSSLFPNAFALMAIHLAISHMTFANSWHQEPINHAKIAFQNRG